MMYIPEDIGQYTSKKTYLEALYTCKALGGKLFEPRSKEENDGVVDLVKSKVSKSYRQQFKIWIGVNDINTEGKFVYSSNGQPVDYTNWKPGDQTPGTGYNKAEPDR